MRIRSDSIPLRAWPHVPLERYLSIEGRAREAMSNRWIFRKLARKTTRGGVRAGPWYRVMHSLQVSARVTRRQVIPSKIEDVETLASREKLAVR